jgi:cysteinyl-tRNA synthetase
MLAEEIESLIAERNKARAAKEFAKADQIRDQLAAAGVAIEDGADGTRWRRN